MTATRGSPQRPALRQGAPAGWEDHGFVLLEDKEGPAFRIRPRPL